MSRGSNLATKPVADHETKPPTSPQIHTAIEVLKSLGKRIHTQAEHSMLQLSESNRTAHDAGRIEVEAIEQTTRIATVVTQLEQWHDESCQDGKNGDPHHV